VDNSGRITRSSRSSIKGQKDFHGCFDSTVLLGLFRANPIFRRFLHCSDAVEEAPHLVDKAEKAFVIFFQGRVRQRLTQYISILAGLLLFVNFAEATGGKRNSGQNGVKRAVLPSKLRI
jgi:hypothetical protein